jgi:arylsulfatase A-like enzyme
VNVLLITLDQFRGDCLSAAGHPVVRTPNLDALAFAGVRLARHYSQAAPCGPGRACLYTGTYQMNNRVVANGTPLDHRFDNVARAARRAGYEPTLFGYTDQSIDPRHADGPDDPRLSDYEGVLPGFALELDLAHERAWHEWLAKLGHGPFEREEALATEPDRRAELSISSFLTDELVDWIRRQDGSWFAHASYLRPHPPYAAAGRWSRAYDPADVPMPIEPAARRHPLHEGALQVAQAAAPRREDAVRALRAQYYGMIGEVDFQLGRVWDALRDLDQWNDTFVVITSDHGEQLGDHGLIEKLGWFEQSYHIVGIVRDPRHPQAHGMTVREFTENVDLFPTLCDAMGVDVPAQCDGLPLTPFLQSSDPGWWRAAAHWEYDWREILLRHGEYPWPWDRRPERQHLAVLRDDRFQYVQFGDGSWRCFDLATDPTGRTEIDDPACVLPLAQQMLTWRSQHADRTMSGMLVVDGGIGRRPPDPGELG